MTPEKRAELHTIIEHCTPAPWYPEVRGNSIPSYAIPHVCSGISMISGNATLICAARNELPELLDELEAKDACIRDLVKRNKTLIEAVERKTVTDRLTRSEYDKAVSERYDEAMEAQRGTIDRLTAELAAVKRERNAVITDLRILAVNGQDCATCKHGKKNLNDCGMYEGPCEWEWRGPCAANAPAGAESEDAHA